MRAIVQRVLKGKKPEDKIVIVVSAMGDTTDDLVALAKQITSKTYGREMDMLLTTGEQVSIALMAMAFQAARRLFPLPVLRPASRPAMPLTKAVSWH